MANKKHLIAAVASAQGVSPAQASANIDAVLNEISVLAFNGGVMLRGFGKFEARKRASKVITTRLNNSEKPAVSPERLSLCFTAGEHQKVRMS
jgi:nucleoid DNA-binding protein